MSHEDSVLQASFQLVCDLFELPGLPGLSGGDARDGGDVPGNGYTWIQKFRIGISINFIAAIDIYNRNLDDPV